MSKTKLIAALIFIIFGFLARIFMVELVAIPNLEIITALALVTGVMLGGIFTFIVPLSVIALSDIYFDNTSIMLFTWSAFAIIAAFGWLLRKRKALRPRFLAEITGLGIVATLFFYLYTNLGWWLLTGMYPYTGAGLIQCYIAGLPFLKNQLFGNLFFVPAFFTLALFARQYYPIFKLSFYMKIKKTLFCFIDRNGGGTQERMRNEEIKRPIFGKTW